MAEGRWRLVRARRDAVPASVRRFSARARRNRLRVAAPWLVASAVVVLLAAGAVVVWYTPAFAVDRIRVQGAALVTEQEVREAAAVRIGTPLARVDATAVRRRVAALPPVRRVRVYREMPSALVIRVTERTPAAVVNTARGLFLMDATGVAYAPTLDRPAGLALLRVAAPAPGDATTRAALTVLAALTPPLRELTAVLAADAPARIRLELADGRTIVWGDATDNSAKARVALLMIGKPGQVIDVSAPDLVTVR
jgi:cell division protein FtsQ